jgi:thiol:disulfide interchange protein DsbD
MRKLLVVAFLFISFFSFAQQLSPVSWSFASKKIGDNVYEVQLVATIQQGWHLYSQEQPTDAIAQPTSFNFNKNPLINFEGKVKEFGKLEKYKDKESIQSQSNFCTESKSERKSENQCFRQIRISDLR